MDNSRLAKRDSSLDIIRIVAVFTVLSVHFFLHNGFYGELVTGSGPIEGLIRFIGSGSADDLHGPAMFVMIMMRTLFGACVPLFIILTGYLMSKKTLSKKYYLGIRKTLIIFVLASVFCMAFKSVHEVPAAQGAFYSGDFGRMFEAIRENGGYTFRKYLLSIFDFSGANYSWYIEMYIGLFLIAPFLNLAYNKLKTKRQKQVLLATFIFLTVIPTIFNIFNFDTATWWVTPTESDEYQKLIPSFWMGVYPIAYYYIGAYIREYGIRLKTRSMLALFAVTLFLISSFSFFRSYGAGYKSSAYVYWYGFSPCLMATMLFTLLTRIPTKNWKPAAKRSLWYVSDLALGIYLMSFISDSLIYPVLNQNVPIMVNRLPYYFVTVPISFIFAGAMSAILNALERLIMMAYYKIKEIVKRQLEIGNNLKWQDLLFAALLAGGVIFSLWKVNYGFGGDDEPFYLTIPHRLSMGDVFFTDEWHLSQLSAFLQLPFTWAYTLITGSTDGIIIAARIFYVVVHAGACVLIYTRLRKRGIISVIGSVLFFLYTPYDIMALDYDSMGVGLVALTGVLLATADYRKKLWIILSGLCFAGAVLCNPYLAVAYLIYALCMVVHLLLRKKELNFALKSEMFSLRTFLFFTLGVGVLAALFLIFTIPRTGISGIFENLPYMLMDPEHPHIPFNDKLWSYIKSVFECHLLFKYGLYAYAAMLIALIFDRRRRLHRSVYLIITAAIVIYTQVLFLPELHYASYNAIMFPMIFMGITAYILCENKPRELFVSLFCFGIFYSVCIHFSSNQYFYVISMAMAATNLASFVFLGQLISEMRKNPDDITYAVWVKRFAFSLTALMIVLQGAFQISAKAQHVFWEGSPSTLTARIENGPAKGIYTNEGNKQSYESYYADIKSFLPQGQDAKVLFMTVHTWMYLAADGYEYGTYSAWLSGENNNSVERLKSYYNLNPEKKPDYIYIPKDSGWEIGSVLAQAQSYGYTATETDLSYHLEKTM